MMCKHFHGFLIRGDRTKHFVLRRFMCAWRILATQRLPCKLKARLILSLVSVLVEQSVFPLKQLIFTRSVQFVVLSAILVLVIVYQFS